jgi:hypothetical protein
MDKEISLARQTEARRAELLARTGAREDEQESICGDEREEDASPAKGNARAKTASYASARSSSSKAKSRDGNTALRHGESNSIGRAIREAKARNRKLGRSAKELGIRWLDARCEESPVTKAHYFIACTRVGDGDIYECKYCHRVKWMPCGIDNCTEFWNYMQIYGKDGAYQRILDENPEAKRMIAKIQDIYYLRLALKDDKAFHIALASIIMDREYPYDIEVIDEEML